MLGVSLIRPSVNAPAIDAGVLVRSALDDAGQQALYQYLCAAAADSREVSMLAKAQARQRPWPLAVWRHPYTEETNAALNPSKVFAWSAALARKTAGELRSSPHACMDAAMGDDDNGSGSSILSLCEELELLDGGPYNSMVSLLYDANAVLPQHVDDGLPGIGLSISLGASATFTYGEESICLRSGDALFGRFGLVEHQVASIHGIETAPAWWRELPVAAVSSTGSAVCSWGRARCNVQLRHGRDGEARRERRERARRRGESAG